MVLVHELLVVLDSRRSFPVKTIRWVRLYSKGATKEIDSVEISIRMVREHECRHGERWQLRSKMPKSPTLKYLISFFNC